MPESPCWRCGRPTLHTTDDPTPWCDECHKWLVALRIVEDISRGTLRISGEGEEETVV